MVLGLNTYGDVLRSTIQIVEDIKNSGYELPDRFS